MSTLEEIKSLLREHKGEIREDILEEAIGI